MLGKRKRDITVIQRSLQSRSAPEERVSQPQSDAHEVFRRYFEAQFEPLAELALPQTFVNEEEDQQGQSDDESEESTWDGVSDADIASDAVQVIKHGLVAELDDATIDSTELKTFMVSHYTQIRALIEPDR